jgi:hypothetical protein
MDVSGGGGGPSGANANLAADLAGYNEFNTSSTSLDASAGYHHFPSNPSDHSRPTTPNATGAGGTGTDAAPTSAASKRREANRLAAARFRTRKKDQVAELESKVASLEAENIGLKAEIQALRLVAASREAGGEVPSYTTLLEAQQMEQQSEAAAVAAAVAAQAQAAAAQAAAQASSSSSSSKRKRKTPGGDAAAAAAAAAAAESSNAVKRGFSITSNEESRPGDNEIEEENGRLKQEVSSYHVTMENMAREIEALRYKVDQQQQQVAYVGYSQNGTPGLQVSWERNMNSTLPIRHPFSRVLCLSFFFSGFHRRVAPRASPKPFPTHYHAQN